jgi:hypothetical protein
MKCIYNKPSNCHCEPPLVEYREAEYRDRGGVAISSNL